MFQMFWFRSSLMYGLKGSSLLLCGVLSLLVNGVGRVR